MKWTDTHARAPFLLPTLPHHSPLTVFFCSNVYLNHRFHSSFFEKMLKYRPDIKMAIIGAGDKMRLITEHIVIGTAGKIKNFVANFAKKKGSVGLDPKQLKLVVFDEADELAGSSHAKMVLL